VKLIKKVTYNGWNCDLLASHYQDNGRLALYLIDSHDREPVAVCTVNLPDKLGENEVFIKDYSENEGMADFLVQEGIVEYTGRHVISGYVTIPVCKFLQSDKL